MSASHFSGPIVSTAGFTPGSSTQSLTFVKKGTIAVNPASMLTLTSNETSVTISGAAAGDIVIMNPPSDLESSLTYGGAYVSATDTVKVRLTNHSAGTVDGASTTWTYCLLRFA